MRNYLLGLLTLPAICVLWILVWYLASTSRAVLRDLRKPWKRDGAPTWRFVAFYPRLVWRFWWGHSKAWYHGNELEYWPVEKKAEGTL